MCLIVGKVSRTQLNFGELGLLLHDRAHHTPPFDPNAGVTGVTLTHTHTHTSTCEAH